MVDDGIPSVHVNILDMNILYVNILDIQDGIIVVVVVDEILPLLVGARA